LLQKQLLTAISPALPGGLLADSVADTSYLPPFGCLFGGGASSREIINLSINKNPEYSLTLSSAPLREVISFENFPGLTNLPIFDLSATTFKRTLGTFLVARIIRIAPPILNPDPSVARILRPDRFSLQLN
jgi:hypothetical protein